MHVEKLLSEPSLAQVSQHFTLNERQHIAFVTAGSHFLDSFLRTAAQEPPGKPLQMHIAGEGGTAKSRIIEALRYLRKAWRKPNAVVTVAPTGIAAVLIKGETVRSNFKTMNYFNPTTRDIEAWSEVYMVIWDEMSMTEQSLFVKAFRNLARILSTKHWEEERVHFITAGDFPLLLPCFGGYMFEKPCSFRDSNDKGIENSLTCDAKEYFASKYEEYRKEYRGRSSCKQVNPQNITAFQLWRNFKIISSLNENMRHCQDPEYGKFLQRLRLGEHTENDIEVLNSRYLNPRTPNDKIHRDFEQKKRKC